MIKIKKIQNINNEKITNLNINFNTTKINTTNTNTTSTILSSNINHTSFIEKSSSSNLLISNSKLKINQNQNSHSRLLYSNSNHNDKYLLNFVQTKIDFNPGDYLTSEYLEISKQTTNRSMRFFYSFIIVIFTSLLAFLLVKYSIDWVSFF